ncbi:hypothetical protein K493DRAFT_19332 [Basidiobolus meristosporus CBS 931.73]|uniref:Uncharacterized protein n=1 Tax=Basidiobolus meristosporus CBS 931.73 TaxID=1314790 RepID=A0A1Y1YEV5_9FUNG|nr:hypothetical protein K493DRAFT_19332 [Basidiobolus meristosporus CBS 931.73]|eukprot:ORX96532.1 hypothetical protein K493DRAFT_19332 [Basidiobolus meristosporus CBS 931.73]
MDHCLVRGKPECMCDFPIYFLEDKRSATNQYSSQGPVKKSRNSETPATFSLGSGSDNSGDWAFNWHRTGLVTLSRTHSKRILFEAFGLSGLHAPALVFLYLCIKRDIVTCVRLI